MNTRFPSLRKLDIAALIESGEVLQGETLLAEWPRLAQGLAPETDPDLLGVLRWQAQGRRVPQRVGHPELWLDLQTSMDLPFTCQRCLHPVTLPVDVERAIRFVADEKTAVELDAELDDDVLVLSRSFDLLTLVEDELIMAAPLVPRHPECPHAVVMSVSDPDVDEVPTETAPAPGDSADPVPLTASGKPNPFAVLAQLKKKPPQG